MKKLLIPALVAVVGVICWKVFLGGTGPAAQKEPGGTVEAFMTAAQRVSKVMWNEEARSQLQEAAEAAEGGDRHQVQRICEQFHIESPQPLFRDKNLAMGALGAVCLFRFDSFSVKSPQIDGERATVTAQFTPEDFMKFSQIVQEAGAPAPEQTRQVSIPFTLEKSGGRWYIVRLGGEVGRLSDALGRLREFR